MGAEQETGRDTRPLRKRPVALLALLVTVTAAALILGETVLGAVAVGLGLVAVGSLIGLANTRAMEASGRGQRWLWLTLFFLGEFGLLTTYWMAAQELTGFSDELPSSLIFGALMSAVITWDLWKAASGNTAGLRLPGFANRSGRVPEPPEKPQSRGG